MPYVFVSYRRTDAPGHAGRIYDWLVARFGVSSVFKDVDSIRAGDEFPEVIDATIARCDAVLAVIGPSWLSAGRLDEPDDWIRLELSKALERRVRVVPVLVAGAVMPAADMLPADLRPLVHRHAVELADATWSTQLERLFDHLDGRERGRSLRRPALRLATLGAVAAVAAGMFAVRDKVDPRESGGAVAQFNFRREIASICESRDAAEAERAVETKRLGKRLRTARTNRSQRDALLDTHRRILASSGFELAQLRGLSVPPQARSSHRAAVDAWTRNNDRIQDYIQRLSAAYTRRRLMAAIEALARDRPAIAHDGVTLSAELIRLGGGRCELEPPKVSATITLPPLPRRSSKSKTTASGSAVIRDRQPSVNPPGTGGGGVISGGGEG